MFFIIHIYLFIFTERAWKILIKGEKKFKDYLKIYVYVNNVNGMPILKQYLNAVKTCPVICQRQPIRRMWAHGKSRLKGEEAGLKQPKALELDKIEL